MDEEGAFGLACHAPEVQSKVLPHKWTKAFSKFERYEGYLDFAVSEPMKTKEEIQEERRKKKEEKKLRKERREQRIREVEKHAKLKAAKPV